MQEDIGTIFCVYIFRKEKQTLSNITLFILLLNLQSMIYSSAQKWELLLRFRVCCWNIDWKVYEEIKKKSLATKGFEDSL